MKRLLGVVFYLIIVHVGWANVVIDSSVVVADAVCNEGERVTLTTSYSGNDVSDTRWYKDGILVGTGKSIDVEGEVGSTYIAQSGRSNQYGNLLINGDFEKMYTGFTSEAITANPPIPNPMNFRKNYAGGDYGKYYAICTNANRYDASYYPVHPVSGIGFILFDVINDRYAWVASTLNNPNLSVIEDSMYVFAFSYANPNMGKDTLNMAKLICEVVDENGQIITMLNEADGILVRANKNQWQRHYYSWKATTTSNITLRIKNTSSNRDGSDFCLDDIEFSTNITHIAYEETHIIGTKSCDEDTISKEEFVSDTCVEGVVYAKWNNVLFVDKGVQGSSVMGGSPVAYQWYKDGIPLDGETEQVYYQVGGISGEIHVQITLDSGRKISSCPHLFEGMGRSSSLAIKPILFQQGLIRYIMGNIRIITYIDEQGELRTIKEFKP